MGPVPGCRSLQTLIEVNTLAKRVIDIKAGDNKYLHRDFHTGLNTGLTYLGEHYGDSAVDDYLARFAQVFYAPQIEDIKARGLVAMQEKIEHDYAVEEVSEDCHTELKDGCLTVVIDKCPGVMHMRANGVTPCKWYKNATTTVYGRIATLSGYGFTMDEYDEQTGASKFRFFKGGADK